jgi:hypothetical protein
MKPDEQIEEEAVDFFLDENLAPDDQAYLLDAIEVDPKLSEIFDRVMLRAIEVSKEGEIEGPGDGDDDAIPARLSDGEFVFSAPAVEIIGVERLEAMHNRAREQAGVSDVMDTKVTSQFEVEGSEDKVEITEPAGEALARLEDRIQKLEGGYVY